MSRESKFLSRVPLRREPELVGLILGSGGDGIEGTGVPMAAREVESVVGKQADGTAKTVICFTAGSRNPKTGDRNSVPPGTGKSHLAAALAAVKGGKSI